MIISLPPVDTSLQAVGQRIRAVREARGLTLEQLARDCRLDQAQLSLAEHGRLRLSSIEVHALIGALHVSPRILFEPGLDVSGLRRL